MTENHDRREDLEGARPGSRDSRKEQGVGTALVSVVIPCYNQAHFLDEAIESVLAQSYPHLEIIVVDDGSPDDTSEVATRYPKVRLVRQENQGLSAARNSGLARSEGEYVVFLDADDRLLPGALEEGLECFEAHPECAFVSGRYRLIAGDGSFLRQTHQPILSEDRYAALLRRSYIGPPITVMYRRSIFESVGGFDTSLSACEDYDLYLRIARRFPIYSHEKLVAEYRRHGASMSRNPALMLSTSVAVLRSQRQYVRGHKQYKEAYKAGVRLRQGNHGDQLVDDVRAHLKEHEWKRALRGTLVLLRYHPRGIALLLLNERHTKRRRLARQLMVREHELKAHERQLKELEEGTVIKERQEVQGLRKETQQLALDVQKLNQRLQNVPDPRTRLLRRLNHIRVKILRHR